jgi:hypothetical protein
MADRQPTAELLATTFETYAAPTPWEQARRRLEQAHDETYWLARGGLDPVQPARRGVTQR